MLPTKDQIIDATAEMIAVTHKIPQVTIIAWEGGKPSFSVMAETNEGADSIPEILAMTNLEFDYFSWFHSIDGETLIVRGVSIGNSCHVEANIQIEDKDLLIDTVEFREPDRSRGRGLLRNVRIARRMAADPGRGIRGRWN